MPRWLSTNPSKAWAERFFLLYSPLWMTAMGLVMALGIDEHLGDWGFLALGLLIALPLGLLPAWMRDERAQGRPWHRTYWFKANLYVAVYSFIGNYFGSEYFFDVLGMVYHFPTIAWNLDSTLVGSGQQRVPFLMYLLTCAYFITYHTTAVVVLRRLRTSSTLGSRYLWPAMLVAVAYGWAWLETFAMANPLIADHFHYTSRDRMLVYGSLFYALYFLTSFPVFYHLDEEPDADWSLAQVTGAALAVGMATLILLDLAAAVFGPI